MAGTDLVTLAHAGQAEHPVALWLRNKQRGNTQTTYARAVEEFARWLASERGKADVLDAEFADLLLYREWLAARVPELKTSTIAAKLRALSAMYGHFARTVDGFTRNPVAAVDMPEITDARLKRAWRIDEIIAFMQAIPAHGIGADAVQAARDRALFWLLFRNGLRVSEAVGARVGDLDDIDGVRVLHIREHGRDDQHVKRGKARLAVLKPETAQLLDAYLRLRHMVGTDAVEVRSGEVAWRDLPLFAPARATGRASRYVQRERRAGASQRFLTRRTVVHMMHVYGARAGLDPDICHPHAARMTAIMALVRAGVDIHAVMTFSGHASLQAVQHYFDMTPDVRKNAALLMPY